MGNEAIEMHESSKNSSSEGKLHTEWIWRVH